MPLIYIYTLMPLFEILGFYDSNGNFSILMKDQLIQQSVKTGTFAWRGRGRRCLSIPREKLIPIAQIATGDTSSRFDTMNRAELCHVIETALINRHGRDNVRSFFTLQEIQMLFHSVARP
jgi:hypothetical protein